MSSRTFWRELALENEQVIREKTLEFIKRQPRIFYRKSGINLMRMDRQAFLDSVPEAAPAFSHYGLTIKEVLAFVMWSPEQCGIHRDNGTDLARINIPILNGRGSYTYFYEDVPTIQIKNAVGTSVTVARDQGVPHADFVESINPFVLRVLELHKVMMPHNHPVPRITLSLAFDPDPVFLLDGSRTVNVEV